MSKKILIFGCAGVGKGTLAAELAKKIGIKHISFGECLREEIGKKTELGQKFDFFIKDGNLVPNELVKEFLTKCLGDLNGFILDGYPRNIEQAKILTEVVPDISFMINLYCVDESILVERLVKRGRKDDAIDIIKNRMVVYHQQTEPVLEFCKNLSYPIFDIDGSKSIKEVESLFWSNFLQRFSPSNFSVQCDEELNTPEVVARNEIRSKITFNYGS